MTAFYACVTIPPATDREKFLAAWKGASLECVKTSICFVRYQSGGATCAPFFFFAPVSTSVHHSEAGASCPPRVEEAACVSLHQHDGMVHGLALKAHLESR